MKPSEKEKYLNDAVRFYQDLVRQSLPDLTKMGFVDLFPRSLFKYRCFDEHTEEMIREGYLYLCAANQLDDPFECLVELDVSKFVQENPFALRRAAYEAIVEYVLEFAAKDQKDETRKLIYACTNEDYTLNCSRALEALTLEQEKLPGVDIPKILNTLANVPKNFQKPENQTAMTKAIIYASEAREALGICSLSESPRKQVMWAMYANNYKGYCVEYDFARKQEMIINTFPVVYSNKRENNVVNNLLRTFLSGLVERLSEGKMTTDQSAFLKMFLVKSEEWSFQDEWRVLGDAGQHLTSPPIKAVYVGHKADEKDIEKMLALSKEFGFHLFKTAPNRERLGIDFVELSEHN